MVTPTLAADLLEMYLREKKYNFETTRHGTDASILVPFAGGFNIKFSTTRGADLRTTLLAIMEDKINDMQQRSVAAAYFAKVNFTLNIGGFQLDLRDGEVLYYASLPLEGIDLNDANMILRDWWNLFSGTFKKFLPGLRAIIRGGGINEAERAVEPVRSSGSPERTARAKWNPPIPSPASAPAPSPVQERRSAFTATSTSDPNFTSTRTSTPAPASVHTSSVRSGRVAEDAVAARAFKDVLVSSGKCGSIESHVSGNAHVVQGVYDYKNTTAVVWGCDETDSKLFEIRVFMVDSIHPRCLEKMSRFVEKVNPVSTVGAFKLDLKRGHLFYSYGVQYAGLTNGQLTALIKGESLALCLGTHQEFLPAIKAIIDEHAPIISATAMRTTYKTARDDEDSDFHRNELVRTGKLVPKSAPPGPRRHQMNEGPWTIPTDRPSDVAGRFASKVPELDLEDLQFEEQGGRGGMGIVRKAKYRHGASVAVKELVDDLAKDAYDFFLKEMRVHFSIPPFPHIVPMVGVTRRSKNDRSFRLVTVWCDGGTLHSLLVKAFGGEDDPDIITYEDALKYARQIAAGIDHLHRHNVLHLDLKPANVLFDLAGGNAKLTDFGLSKIVAAGTQSSHIHHRGGTLGFQAPEIIDPLKFPKEKRVGPHTDIYSLGVTMFLMFYGVHRPYSTVVPAYLIDKQVPLGVRPMFPSQPPWSVGYHVKEMVTRLIEECWANDPDVRPSAVEVLKQLNEIESTVQRLGGTGMKIAVGELDDSQFSSWSA